MMAADIFDGDGNSGLQSPVLGFMPPEPPDLVAKYGLKSGDVQMARPPEAVPLSNAFLLHSRPTATKTIYLDFDGFTCVGTSWNTSNNITTIVSPAYDPAGNGAAFTDAELTQIIDFGWCHICRKTVACIPASI